jgi:hypothetical protein
VSADSTAAPPPWQVEEWVYLGPSATLFGSHRWRDAAGAAMSFKRKARVFGGIHVVKAERTADSVTLYGEPEFTGRLADDAALLQTVAMHAEASVKRERLARSTSRTGAIDSALEPLLDIARGYKTFGDRKALLDYVTARIYGA